MPDTSYPAPDIRPGAAPQLDVPTVGFDDQGNLYPIYYAMTEMIVRWLRYHFSAATRIEYPSLTDRVWTTDQERSPIQITSLAEWKPTNANQRPAILIDRQEQEKDMNVRSIGDQLHGIKPGAYQHFVNGQHVVHCLGGREGEAETLAAEVWRELVRFAPVARERLCLWRFLPVRVGKRTQLDEHKEVYTVPVICIYSYSEAWKIRPLDEDEINQVRVGFTAPPNSV